MSALSMFKILITNDVKIFPYTASVLPMGGEEDASYVVVSVRQSIERGKQ